MNTEQPDLGEQYLLPGIKPVPLRGRPQLLADMPRTPHCQQRPCDIRLFDEPARTQLDLFSHTKE